MIEAPFILVAEATPRDGVTRVGEVANTRDQEPVSSLITHFNCSEVVAANCASVHEVSASHPPAGVHHLIPVTSDESAIGIVPFAPIASRDAVLAPVPTARSHLASQIESVATDQLPRVSILSYRSFFVGTSLLQFHPAP